MTIYKNPQMSPWKVSISLDGTLLKVAIESKLTQPQIKDLVSHIEWVLDDFFVGSE